MTRYRLTIEYDGTPFVGWQRQDNGMSVQQAIEEAFGRFAGETVATIAAGRTDAGVHALGQVIHAELNKPWDPFRISDALNFHLKPYPVAALDCIVAPASFHARFSAVGRRYRYRIANRRAPLTIEHKRAWEISRPLDHEAMHQAAQLLVGKHDFTSFRASLCQAKSPLKTLTALSVTRLADELVIEARAPSFLHHQVRNIVGTLVQVGLGKLPVRTMRDILAARDRSAAGETAPAHGLYLVAVDYPDEAPLLLADRGDGEDGEADG
jgi:tRNA pseudouridine38-40 synthase